MIRRAEIYSAMTNFINFREESRKRICDALLAVRDAIQDLLRSWKGQTDAITGAPYVAINCDDGPPISITVTLCNGHFIEFRPNISRALKGSQYRTYCEG